MESRQVPGTCPKCHSTALEERRVDHVFTLFFIPLFKVQRGQPFLVCRNCGWDSRMESLGWLPQGPELNPIYGGSPESQDAGMARRLCPHCGSPVDASFLYCPYCGTKMGQD